jgi:hypothetical protein
MVAAVAATAKAALNPNGAAVVNGDGGRNTLATAANGRSLTVVITGSALLRSAEEQSAVL